MNHDQDAVESEPPAIIEDSALSEMVMNEIWENGRIMSPSHRTWSNHLITLAFVFYAASAKAYRFVRKLMPLPSVSQLYQRIGPKLRFLQTCLTSIDRIGLICESWRLQEEIPPNELVHAILGCDAASYKTDQTTGQRCGYCFAFIIMPLNPRFSTCVCHLCSWSSGAMGEDQGISLCKQIAKELIKSNISIVAMASDGDRSYIGYQNSIFDCYKETGLSRPLEELSNLARGSCWWRFWWLADPLHALKCQRCRLRNKVFVEPGRLFDAASIKLMASIQNSGSSIL